VDQFRPRVAVLDPVTDFAALGSEAEVKAMLTRLIDFFKTQQITALFTSLTAGGTVLEATNLGVSSLMDTWLLLRDVLHGAERNRFLHIVKSRGMAHSNQMREFLLTDHGVELRDVYVGPSGLLLAGGAREELEAQEKAQVLVRGQETEAKKRNLESKRQAMEAQVAVLQAEFEVEEAEAAKTIGQDQTRAGVLARDRLEMAQLRQGGAGAPGKARRQK
jgi:circadian clock protein KaiC